MVGSRMRSALAMTILATMLLASWPGVAEENLLAEDVYVVFVPYGSTWKFFTHDQNDVPAAPPYPFQTNYDDSSWATASSPFGNAECEGVTPWNAADRIWLRKWLEFPEGTHDVDFELRSAGEANPFINGRSMGSGGSVTPPCDRHVHVSDPDGQLVAGPNLFAVWAIGEGIFTYLDVQISGWVPVTKLERCVEQLCVEILYMQKDLELAAPVAPQSLGTLRVERGVLEVRAGQAFVGVDVLTAQFNGVPSQQLLNHDVAGQASTTYSPRDVVLGGLVGTGHGGAAPVAEVWDARVRHYIDGKLRSDVPVQLVRVLGDEALWPSG